MERLENKGFPNDSSGDLEKEVLKTPMPYCLCHKLNLKTSMLETKQCVEKVCSYLVFVKEIWSISRKNGEMTLNKRFHEVKMA